MNQFDEAIEAWIDSEIEDDIPASLIDPNCPYCCHGIVAGDHVPYGEGMAQLPNQVCECVYEIGWVHVQQLLRAGELEYKDGRISEVLHKGNES